MIINQNSNTPKYNPYWDYIKMNLIDVNFNELKKVLTLSTCYNENEKVLLHAKLIKLEQK